MNERILGLADNLQVKWTHDNSVLRCTAIKVEMRQAGDSLQARLQMRGIDWDPTKIHCHHLPMHHLPPISCHGHHRALSWGSSGRNSADVPDSARIYFTFQVGRDTRPLSRANTEGREGKQILSLHFVAIISKSIRQLGDIIISIHREFDKLTLITLKLQQVCRWCMSNETNNLTSIHGI